MKADSRLWVSCVCFLLLFSFPVDKFGVSYRVLWNCFKRISDRMALPTEARDQLFFGTANAVYQLGL